MKACEAIQELLTAYALHDLDDQDAGLVQGHIDTCPACAAELADIQSTLDLLGSALNETAPETAALSLDRIEAIVTPQIVAPQAEARPRLSLFELMTRPSPALRWAAGVVFVLGLFSIGIFSNNKRAFLGQPESKMHADMAEKMTLYGQAPGGTDNRDLYAANVSADPVTLSTVI